jgi:TrmH family RNA methyltransferase
LKVYLAEVSDGEIYSCVDWRISLALIIGSEAEGAGPDAQHLANKRVIIPMPGGGESLNAASAAAVLLFEAVRQRASTLINR